MPVPLPSLRYGRGGPAAVVSPRRPLSDHSRALYSLIAGHQRSVLFWSGLRCLTGRSLHHILKHLKRRSHRWSIVGILSPTGFHEDDYLFRGIAPEPDPSSDIAITRVCTGVGAGPQSQQHRLVAARFVKNEGRVWIDVACSCSGCVPPHRRRLWRRHAAVP